MPKTVGGTKQTFCNQFIQELLKDCYDDEEFLSGGKWNRQTANEMIDTMNRHSKDLNNGKWEKLDSAEEARQLAQEGYLVVAGKKAAGHGHVAVVVAADSVPNGKNDIFTATSIKYSGTGVPRSITDFNGSSTSPQPIIMQAGNSLGFMTVKNGFGRSPNSVDYFVYKNNCGCDPY